MTTVFSADRVLSKYRNDRRLAQPAESLEAEQPCVLKALESCKLSDGRVSAHYGIFAPVHLIDPDDLLALGS